MKDRGEKGLGHAQQRGVIIVLGSPNDELGNLSSVALERCRQARREFLKNPGFFVLLTGGWGSHFNRAKEAHFSYLRKHLISTGFPEFVFLEGVPSSNTLEDASFSRPVLDAHGIRNLIVVTSDFHGRRARLIFEREFPGRAVRFSLCRTDLPLEELDRLRAHEEQAIRRLEIKKEHRQ